MLDPPTHPRETYPGCSNEIDRASSIENLAERWWLMQQIVEEAGQSCTVAVVELVEAGANPLHPFR